MRGKVLTALAAAALAAFITAPASAQRDFSRVNIVTQKVADGFYMLLGAGGNIGVSVGEDGVFLIDDQFAPLTDKIVVAVRKLSDKPIKFVLNTHWHGDHTGGNENLGRQGSIIVAHDQVRELMSKEQFMRAFNRPVPPAPRIALPTITFREGTTFHMNGQTLAVRHLPGGHTGGDSFVHIEELDVIHTGDLFFNGFYPFIDVQHGGGINGMIAAADKILSMAGPNTKIIPGHGPLADKAALERYRDMLKTVRTNVAAAMSGGKSIDDVIAAKPTAATDGKWGGGFLRPDVFTRIVYSSLAK